MKKCPSCETTKGFEEFHSGASYCKPCACKKSREQRKRNKGRPKPKIETKFCAKCLLEKSTKSSFYRDAGSGDGFYSYCKECTAPINHHNSRVTRRKTSEKNRALGRQTGVKKCYGCQRTLHTDNFYLSRSNTDGFSKLCKPCGNRRRKKWRDKARHTIRYKITNRVRARFNEMLRRYNIKKVKPISKYGIDIGAIAESLGDPPGRRGDYHIDHIFPICAFDVTNPLHISICFHPSNLRWCLREENQIKHDDYDRNEFEKYLELMIKTVCVNNFSTRE